MTEICVEQARIFRLRGHHCLWDSEFTSGELGNFAF